MDFKNKLTAFLIVLLLPVAANADWFDEIRDGADKEALYRTLYYMPKGGDLHNHLSGAVFAEWWYELALAQQERRYEYYVATTEFRLSWEEIKTLGRNSLAHAFLTEEHKEQLLREYNERIGRFERQVQRRGIAQLGPMPETRSFTCNRYGLCR